MSRKKLKPMIIPTTVAFIALVLSVVALVKPMPQANDYADEIEALQEHNDLLQSQLDALTAQLSSSSLGGGLSGWDLSLTPWENAPGASVTLTTVPANYEEDMTASFSIRLNGREVSKVPCSWNGEAFTATAELAAEDGYGFYCILMDAEGEKQQYALTTPENPVMDVPVYLASSLSSYCNMTVDSWFDKDGVLNLSLAYVQAQLPRLSASGSLPTVESAQLRLYYNGDPYSAVPITLESGEAEGAYALTVTGVELNMPQVAIDECLDLYLEITLSDGQTLTALGASWYGSSDGLFAVMG